MALSDTVSRVVTEASPHPIRVGIPPKSILCVLAALIAGADASSATDEQTKGET